MILSFLVTFELSIRLNVDTVHDQGLGILRRKKNIDPFFMSFFTIYFILSEKNVLNTNPISILIPIKIHLV